MSEDIRIVNGKPVRMVSWPREELDLLSKLWPKGGIKAVGDQLPRHKPSAIVAKANWLGLKVEGRKPAMAQPATEWIDAQIRRAYLNGRPRLKVLAKDTNRKIGWLKMRACWLGVTKSRWKPEEDAIVRRIADEGASVKLILKALSDAGFKRTPGSVNRRVYHLGCCFRRDNWTAKDMADAFGVDDSVVVRWIRKGMLYATRQRGRSSRITKLLDENYAYDISFISVRKFMYEYPNEWDHRKMQKGIMLELLSPNAIGIFGGANDRRKQSEEVE
jgi:hypothetical protein